jgi:alpha/beta superfamily hydrolase
LRELDGYACVVNTNDGFHLAVRTSEAVYATNLFEEGAVVNYTVAPARDIIYATATQAGEPAGIWEYDIKRKVQRRIFNGTAGKSVQPQTIRPSRFQVKSYDGMQISCFLLKTALSQGNGSHRSPLVIYLPPTSAQVQRGFMPFQQLLAKLGFACLSVNYRGCDGYGKAFARLKDPANAARDVLVALDTVLKRGDIDKANIFLYSASAGSEVAMELLKDAHHSWNGALLEYPTAIPQETFSVKSIPSILIVTGEKDPVFKSLGSLSTWARNRDMPVKLIVHTNLGHFNYKLNERRMDMDQGASLFFRNLK